MEALLSPTGLVSSFGYLAIFVLSVAQSCCVPTSSELTLGFAGALAATGRLNLVGAILAGAVGEVVGAYLAWVIGRTAGRAIVDRYGKYVLLTHHDLDRAEAWYSRHERWGVFGGRLLPVVRNFVALPAGVAEVPLVRFGLLTAAGSLVWDGAMAGIGYGVGSRWHTIVHAFSDAGYVIGALAVVAIVAAIVHRWRAYGAQMASEHGAVGGPGTGRTSGPGAAAPAASRLVTAVGATGSSADAPPVGVAPANPRDEVLALVRRLAAPGSGVGERNGAGANERLTAATAVALFVLIFLEGVTLLHIHGLLVPHVVIGLVLVPPVVLKLGSTGWRFMRYYTRNPAFVHKGPPQPLLRLLAPVLVLTTVVLFASGIALVAVHRPNQALVAVHRDDFVLWFVVLAVHVLAYMWQVPGIVRRDLSSRRLYRRSSPPGRHFRLGLVVGSVACGVALTIGVWPALSSHVHSFFSLLYG